MTDTPESRRFQAALRMSAEGLELMRQNLRRRYPTESGSEIDRRLAEWVFDRPMDAPGPVVAP